MRQTPFDNDFITIDDLYISYRKAKQEAFYESSNISAIRFAKYEEQLSQNIERLHLDLTNGSDLWVSDNDFIGGYLYIPKSLDEGNWSDIESSHFSSIDPIKDWEYRFKTCKRKLDAEYRLIIDPTVNYQIISALWILKVGHKFEEKLDKKLSYGNRLRRKANFDEKVKVKNDSVNLDCIGLFQPYFSAYQNWRNTGLNTMRRLIKNDEDVTAITMDIASFYHNVSPNFVLDKKFLNTINVSLDNNEKILTSLFITSINHWYKGTPDFKKRDKGALPVGLSASKIISNILLYELDIEIKNNLKPAYYGRYVDDIFLVIKGNKNNTSHKVLSQIRDSVNFLKLRHDDNKTNLKIDLNYAKDSDLYFKEEKQKIFNLNSKHGLDLIDQISEKIREQSSEYKMLADVPETSGAMAKKTLLTSSDASLVTDALRKADYISIKRWSFSVLLRNIQNYTTNLQPNEWKNRREEFYDLVSRYFITPKGIFELYNFIPRIFRILIENQDLNLASDFLNRLDHCIELIIKTTSINGLNKQKIQYFRQYISKVTFETLVKSSTEKSMTNIDGLNKIANECLYFGYGEEKKTNKSALDKLRTLLLDSDLGSRPYKEEWFYRRKSYKEEGLLLKDSTKHLLRIDGISEFLKRSKNPNANLKAFAFPTRPLTFYEIALSCHDVMHDELFFKNTIFSLRGANVTTSGLIGYNKNSSSYEVNIPSRKDNSVYIAVTNFEVTNEQFEGALNSVPDRTISRFEKITHTINSIIRCNKKVDYVVFPECSIPRQWAINIAKSLARHNISFICGVEYYQSDTRGKTFNNDCLVSLTTQWPGYNTSFLLLQPKQQPSHHEKYELSQIGGKLYNPKKSRNLPIYKHGNYTFGVLICSDLTNPINRHYYQGKVDSLFVLSWNRDINTFSYLVDSAAHDIHAYIILVNNRAYGDSRVRVPAKQSYKRDIIRIKGGEDDYFAIAKISYMSLRRFHNKLDGTGFKPLPIGFKCSKFRKYLVN